MTFLAHEMNHLNIYCPF